MPNFVGALDEKALTIETRCRGRFERIRQLSKDLVDRLRINRRRNWIIDFGEVAL